MKNKNHPDNPNLKPHDEMWEYSDYNGVWGLMDIQQDGNGKKHIFIHEWTSDNPGLGHADRALRWLKSQGDSISASAIGSIDDGVGDISVLYWIRQREKGLVGDLFLDDGTELNQGMLASPAVERKAPKLP